MKHVLFLYIYIIYICLFFSYTSLANRNTHVNMVCNQYLHYAGQMFTSTLATEPRVILFRPTNSGGKQKVEDRREPVEPSRSGCLCNLVLMCNILYNTILLFFIII